ncbi:MAG: hypothetical protein ABSE62_02955 [Chthoniobacteraceae bacterium]|jgi:hypothetical protein
MKASEAVSMPKPVSGFLRRVAERLPRAVQVAEPGGVALGNWWLDIKSDTRAMAVEWRAGRGFGIYTAGQEAYGEGPREIFRDAPTAARRVIQLLSATERTHFVIQHTPP